MSEAVREKMSETVSERLSQAMSEAGEGANRRDRANRDGFN
jgi:hypothetical protein